MQNPGQTRIFYKPDQIHLTWTKRDPVNPANLYALIMVSVPNQSNELSMLDSDDGSVAPDFLYHILKDWLYN